MTWPELIWPIELPQKVRVDGYGEQPPMTDRETTVELGVGMGGGRATVAAGSFVFTLDLLDRQVPRLDRFYRYEAKGGIRWWRFPHPRLHGSPLLLADGSPITMADGSPILLSSHVAARFKPGVGLKYPPMGNGVWWRPQLQLDWLPL
jgi:hypothetical protein